MKNAKIIKTSAAVLAASAALAVSALCYAANEKDADDKAPAKIETITGEVVDMMCYLDHGAKGLVHRGCATMCIRNGGPVGLLSGDQLYLVVGNRKPINDQLASKAADTIRIKGKVVERNGVKMIENAELQ